MSTAWTLLATFLLLSAALAAADQGSNNTSDRSGTSRSGDDDSNEETLAGAVTESETETETETETEDGETRVRIKQRMKLKINGQELATATDEEVRATLKDDVRRAAMAAAGLDDCVKVVREAHPDLADRKLNALCRGLKPEWARAMVAKHLVRADELCDKAKNLTEEERQALPPGHLRFCAQFDGLSAEERARLAAMGDNIVDRLAALDADHWARIKKMREGTLSKIRNLREERLRKLMETLGDSELSLLADSLTEDDLGKLSLLGRAEIKAMAKEDIAGVKTRLARIRIKSAIDEDALIRHRFLAKEQLQRARQNFKDARERFKLAHDRFEEARHRFQEFRDKEKACEGQDTPECQEARENAKEEAKAHLAALADKVLDAIAQMKAKIQESEDLDEADASQMLANLDALAQEIEDAKADLEAATTKEEIKEAGKAIITAWKRVHARLLKHRAKLLNGRIERILTRSEHLEDKLERVLARLAERGQDVSALDARLAEFSEHIAEAREDYEAGRGLLVEAHRRGNESNITAEKAKELIDAAQARFKSAHEHLKLAHAVLQGIMREANALGASIEAAAETEVEVAVEASTPIQEDPVQLLSEASASASESSGEAAGGSQAPEEGSTAEADAATEADAAASSSSSPESAEGSAAGEAGIGAQAKSGSLGGEAAAEAVVEAEIATG